MLIFILDGYADWEPAYICAELNTLKTDYIVKTISLDKAAKQSMGGFRVLQDYFVDDFPKDFSLLIFSGRICMAETGCLDSSSHSENTLDFMKFQDLTITENMKLQVRRQNVFALDIKILMR